jgi:hypothetical protein
MTVKQRGRPPGPAGTLRQAMLNPPPHIQARLAARGGKLDQRWVDVLMSMDEFMGLITAYRRKFRITHQDAEILLAGLYEAIPSEKVQEARSHCKSWKVLSDKGLRGRGYETPEWHMSVKALLIPKDQPFRKRSDRQIAQLVKGNEIRTGRKPPDERSIRRLIKKLKDSGAYL